MKYVKRSGNIQDRLKIRALESKIADMEAVLDYMAMMTDVDLSGGDEDVHEDQEVL
jgi:hypothetical protein